MRLNRARNRFHDAKCPVVSLRTIMEHEDDHPLISVIIPTFNRADLLLTRGLPSVLQQTHRKIEVLVCAHGCTDETHSEVWARRARDPRIRLLKVPREQTYPPTAENHWLAGPVAPITAGLRAARGDWIARIDDDDEWDEDHLEVLLREARERAVEFMSSDYRVIDNDKKTRIVKGDGDPVIGGVQTWLYRSYLRFMKPNPECWRKKWNKVNDMDLAERFRKAGVWIGYLDSPTATIRPRPGETKIGSAAYRENAESIERRMAFT